MEVIADNPRSSPPSVTQEAAHSPPGIKDPPSGAAEQYRGVLPLPLADNFTGRVGHPKMIKGGEEPDADAYEGGGGVSGKGTLAHNPVPRNNNKKKTENSSWPTKRGRRRQEKGLVSSIRSWRLSAL